MLSFVLCVIWHLVTLVETKGRYSGWGGLLSSLCRLRLCVCVYTYLPAETKNRRATPLLASLVSGKPSLSSWLTSHWPAVLSPCASLVPFPPHTLHKKHRQACSMMEPPPSGSSVVSTYSHVQRFFKIFVPARRLLHPARCMSGTRLFTRRGQHIMKKIDNDNDVSRRVAALRGS